MPEHRREAEGRREHVGVAADMDAERRHEPGAAPARQGLGGGVEERRPGEIGEDGGRGREGEEEVEARHQSTLST